MSFLKINGYFLIVFIVVFGGFWLSLLSLKHLDASLAGALGSTAPLFILPVAAILLGEKISLKAGLATAVAVGSSVLGTLISFQINAATGPAIVLIQATPALRPAGSA